MKSKQLFIGLLMLILTGIGIIVGAIWSLNFVGFNLFSRGILISVGVILSGLVLVLVLGLVGIVVASYRGKPVPGLVIPTKLVISYFLPVVVELGKVLGLDKEEIMSSFIQLGNQLIDPEEVEVKPEEVLILAPHCIQWSECEHRVTNDWSNCQRCGGCQVEDLIELTEKYGVKLEVATGGTRARRIIKQIRPKMILAIACERDLSSGIKDVYPLPVVGVVNLRPNGPCFNTKVEIDKIEEALEEILS
jgi:hypothetical protein